MMGITIDRGNQEVHGLPLVVGEEWKADGHFASLSVHGGGQAIEFQQGRPIVR